MGETLFYILRINLTAAAFIFMIMGISRCVGMRYSARWKYASWLVLAVVLLIPVDFSQYAAVIEVQVPVMEIPADRAAVTVRTGQPAEAETSGTQDQKSPSLDPVPSAGESAENLNEGSFVPAGQNPELSDASYRENPVPISLLLLWVWIAGSVLTGVVQILKYRTACRTLRRWSIPVSQPAALKLLDSRKRSLGIQRPLPVLISGSISSPMIAGLRNPALYLPARSYTYGELDLIFHHELVHFKRRDLWYKLLLILVRTVYWFNPAVYLMVREAEKDVEYICDEYVTRDLNRQDRMVYNRLLLGAISTKQTFSLLISTNFDGGISLFRKRIANIMYMRRRKSGRLLALLCCVVLLAGTVLIGCSQEQDGVSADSQNVTDSSLEKQPETSKSAEPNDEKPPEPSGSVEEPEAAPEKETQGSWRGEEYYDAQGNLVENDSEFEYEVTKSGKYITYTNRIYGFSFQIPRDWENNIVVEHYKEDGARLIKFSDKINYEKYSWGGGGLFYICVTDREEEHPYIEREGVSLYHFTFNGKEKSIFKFGPTDVQFYGEDSRYIKSYRQKMNVLYEILDSVKFDTEQLGTDNKVTNICEDKSPGWPSQDDDTEELGQIREIKSYLLQNPDVMARALGLEDSGQAGDYTGTWKNAEVFEATLWKDLSAVDYVLIYPNANVSLFGIETGMDRADAGQMLRGEGWENVSEDDDRDMYEDDEGNNLVLLLNDSGEVYQIVWSSKVHQSHSAGQPW